MFSGEESVPWVDFCQQKDEQKGCPKMMMLALIIPAAVLAAMPKRNDVDDLANKLLNEQD